MSNPADGTFLTLMHWGAFEVDTQGGEIVEARGLATDPAPSPLGAHLLSRTNNRIARPAVRASWLERGVLAKPERRGLDPYVDVEWDQALDLVHQALEHARSEFGNESIFAGSYGWGSAGRFHHPQSQMKRFLNCIGGFTSSHGTYSHGAAEVAVTRILGTSFSEFQRSAPSATDIAEQTELLVSFGGLPAANTQIVSGGDVVHSYQHTVRRAAERGCRFVSISPAYGDFDAAIGAEWLAIRPGTDAALMLGLAGELLQADQHDREFLATYCAGADILIEYLRGSADGVIKNAQWASEICGVSQSRIVDLAQALAHQRSLINATWSTQRVVNGEQTFWAQIALVSFLGQMGTPGAGLSYGFGSMGSVGARSLSKRLTAFPQGENPVAKAIPVARIADALANPGGHYRFDGADYTFPHIDLIYWSGGNPFHHHQDLNRLDRLWRRPRSVIVNEPFWTATAMRADVVLPTTIGTERNDIGGASTGGHLVAMSQAVQPFGEARHDHAIFVALAERFGVKDAFTQGRAPAEWMRWMYDHTRERVPELPPYERFLELGVVARPADESSLALADFLAAPTVSPVSTQTGRISLALDHFERPGEIAHPRWESAVSSQVANAPDWFHLVTPMPADRLHAQYGPADSPLPLHMHPDDLTLIGLDHNATVRVHNDRGAFVATLHANSNIRPGVVSAENGMPLRLVDTPAGPLCVGGNVNVVTEDRPTSSWAQATAAHTCLVQVELCEVDQSFRADA